MRKLNVLEMNRLTVEEFHEAEKMPLIVVLDDVRSLYNVGSVFRTYDAFRVQALWLCGITATPPHNEIHKTALGAEDAVSWQYFKTAEEAVAELKRQGYYTYAVEQAEGSTKAPLNLSTLQPFNNSTLQQFNTSSPLPTMGTGWAIVLGNEVKGVHQSVVDACDECLEIPQFGTKHSMNVSVTAGIVIWEFARQWLLKTK